MAYEEKEIKSKKRKKRKNFVGVNRFVIQRPEFYVSYHSLSWCGLVDIKLRRLNVINVKRKT